MTGRKRNRLVAIRVVQSSLIIAAMAIASCSSGPSSQSLQKAKVAPVDYAWLDSVNLELYHCSRALAGGGSHTFYLVGEVHVYNEPSSRFADSLLARLQPGLFMSEGADSTQPRSQLMKDLSSSRKSFFGEIGYNKPELFRLAQARGIPVVWLEDIDTSTGLYTGVTKSEAKGLAASIPMMEKGSMMKSPMVMAMMKKMLDDPEGMYKSLMQMLSQMGMDTVTFKRLIEKQEPESGIITKRNELMSTKAITYILPENGCILIRFGMGHSEGMIEQLKQSDCECEPQSLQAFLEGD